MPNHKTVASSELEVEGTKKQLLDLLRKLVVEEMGDTIMPDGTGNTLERWMQHAVAVTGYTDGCIVGEPNKGPSELSIAVSIRIGYAFTGTDNG